MPSVSWVKLGALLPGIPFLLGCAGAGPDLNGPEGPNLMAAYSGDWVLDPAQSDDLDQELRASMRRSGGDLPGGGMTGRRPGGTGGGGAGGGGGRGGGMQGGMGGSQMDPEAMRAAMDLLRGMARAPRELNLTLRPGTVTLAENAAAITVLNLGAEKEDIFQGGAKLLGTARWTKAGIEIKRELEMGGGIKDSFSLNESGSLVLRREVDMMRQSVKGELVYVRKSQGG